MRALGAGKRVPVRVTLNGVRYRSTIAVYGGKYYVPARKEIREAAKLEPGSRPRVTLEADLAPRSVTVPSDLARALRTAELTSTFEALAFTRREEYVDWITGAKREWTRATRIREGAGDGPARPAGAAMKVTKASVLLPIADTDRAIRCYRDVYGRPDFGVAAHAP